MGFELNRIMKQYGVNTPGMANYSGAAAPVIPVAPAGTRPTGEDDAATAAQTAYDSQKSAYDAYKADPKDFNEMMRKYQLDQKSYGAYKSDYQNRLQNTPMYLQSQFDSGYGTTASTNPTGSTMRDYADKPGGVGVDRANLNIKNWFAQNPNASAAETKAAMDKWNISDADVKNAMGSGFSYGDGKPAGYGSTGVRYATAPGGVGMDKYNQNISSWLKDHPYASNTDIQAEKDKWGISNKDLYNATGSYWGNQVSNPTYGAVPVSMGNNTAQQKADYYLQQRNLGYTDADIRGAADKTFGKQLDSDWSQLVARAYPQYNANVVDAYKSIGRSWENGQIDAPGYNNYWMNQLSTGAFDPKNLNSTFAQAAADEKAAADAKAAEALRASTIANTKDVNNQLATSLNVNKPPSNYVTDYLRYAHGGQVKTHYQTAGAVTLPSGYSDPANEAEWIDRWAKQQQPVEVGTVNMVEPSAPVISEAPEAVEAPPPKSALTEIAVNNAKNASEPVGPAATAAPKPTAAVPFGGERMGNIQALLATYGPKDSAYGEDLKAARTSAKAESDAFAKMLTGAMNSPEDDKSSKAEMYFRLAAAFGSPTKTGQFSENLGMVGKELGDYAKNKRASNQQKLALALEGQKMKMTAAKDDLRTLQALTGEEMKDKRAIATELIKDYIKSGEPQSTAGKQALDEGLKPGTPDYQKRVAEIGSLNVEGKLAQINASLAGVSLAQANLALNQEKFANQKTQQAKLSPTEVKMKSEAEDLIASSKQSLADLKQAYALNPNSLAGGWMDKSQQFLSEAAGSKDPTVVNTRILNNLLGSQGLAKLRSTFGGNPTEGERSILLELEGIGAKTKEERGTIIKRTYKVLQDRMAREQARLDQINTGSYRQTAPIEGGNE